MMSAKSSRVRGPPLASKTYLDKLLFGICIEPHIAAMLLHQFDLRSPRDHFPSSQWGCWRGSKCP